MEKKKQSRAKKTPSREGRRSPSREMPNKKPSREGVKRPSREAFGPR